jgi:CubicO group peptidase (beta-lactamase class C family)
VLALGDADPYVQGQAAVALGRMGRAAVPSLTIALESTNPSVRKGSITALGRMGGAAAPVLPTLVKALGDADAGVRCGAVIALGEVGSLGKTAAPAVREALHDADEEVRWAAGWALERLGAEPGPGAVETLKVLTPALMKALKVPGVSIAVIQDRKVSWSGAFGQAQVPDGRLVAEDTVFEACSMSKVVFAHLVLKLVDRGMLDLDRPLCHYLDEAAIPTQAERRLITARMVLSHTSGLPNWRKGGEETEGPLPVKFRPGSRFSYSGEGMFYLQRVLEHLADEPLELLAERTLFRPLGMDHTSFVWTPALGPKLAAGHKADGTFKERTQYLHANAAYSLYTTPRDFAAFLLAFLNPAGAGGAALSPASLKACLTPQVSLDSREPMERPGAARGRGVGWGLGWSINTTATGTLFHHSGANSSGFRCFTQFDPARGTGLVIMTNGMAGGELWTRLVSQVGDL